MNLFCLLLKIKLLRVKPSSFCLLLLLFSSTFVFSQQTETVDFISVKAVVRPLLKEKKVIANASYTFKILKKCDSVYLDAQGVFLLKNIPNHKIAVILKNKKIWLVSNFEPNQTYTVSFQYETSPKKALYFLDQQIWTQGQGKYTSNWLPSIDDMNDKIEFDISYIIPSDKTIVANGKLVAVTDHGDAKKWSFDMEHPMSSYLVAFAVGDFSKKAIASSSNVPMELYYPTSDSLLIEPTYRYSKRIFDFLEHEIDVDYPWQNYKQVPLKDFLYAGMENTSATFFSDAFIVDSIGFVDRNYVNVNAHELAHQWVGNLVTETSGESHWLHEGFASYYALLTEKEIFGEDYYYWKLFQSAEQLKSLSEEGKGAALNNPKASSLIFYEKGAWALHILREKVGDAVFKKAIKNYLEKYQYKNVTTNDFIIEVERAYGKELIEFKKDWILQSAFKSEQAYQSLIKSNFINEYFKISALRGTPITLKMAEFEKALVFPDDFIGQEIVDQLINEPLSLTLPLYKKAFNSNNVFVRQAIALSMDKIPKELKSYYESLLYDNSYLTQETALGNLWVNFPENKSKYLDEMDGIIGFRDKNIRQFWLFLALITEGYQTAKKEFFLEELVEYTSSKYAYNIREKALEYIGYLNVWDRDSLVNLIDASQHHYWRFRDFSRDIFKGLLEDEKYREQFMLLKQELDTDSLKFLKMMLNEK
jgi:aminopeptidase N